MVITLESSSELSPGEDAVVEVEELLPAVDEAVCGGQHQTRPAQAGLQQPAGAWLSCQLSGGVAQLSAVSTHLNSLHDSEADTEGREVMPRMTATK